MKHPYIWNRVDPQLFYGQERETLLEELLKKLPGIEATPASFAIAGGRRMGKSTLLRRLEKQLQAQLPKWQQGGLTVIPIYIDGQRLPRPLPEDHIWKYILKKLKKILKSLELPTVLDFYTFCETLEEELPKTAPKIIILLDEIEIITKQEWADGFLSNWRALLSNTPGVSEHITLVLAGANEVSKLKKDIGSPLANVLEGLFYLKNLDFNSACQLMEVPLKHQWPETFKQQVFKETAGHPMLLQFTMQFVCDQIDDLSSVSEIELENLVDNAIKIFMEQQRWQFQDWWEKYCIPTAQRIYTRLPDDMSTLSLSQLITEFGITEANDALEILLHVGIVAEEDDGLAFRRAGEMFYSWYKKYATLKEISGHDKKIYEGLRKVDQKSAKRYLAAWQIYQKEELADYADAVNGIRETFNNLLRVLAPIEEVKKHSNDPDPKRRHSIAYIVQKRDEARQLDSDYNILEIDTEKFSKEVNTAYGRASGKAHTTANREQAYEMLKRFESVLARLLLYSSNSPRRMR